MKQHSEERTGHAVKQLLQTLEQNIADTDRILTEFEETHDDGEISRSRQYNALLAGQQAMRHAINKINNQLKEK